MQQLGPGWQVWIAENLTLGVAQDDLVAVLVSKGFSAELASTEVTLAAGHPYLMGASKAHAASSVSAQLAKRNWLLSTYETAARCAQAPYIPVVNNLPGAAFRDGFYSRNLPVLIKDAIAHWIALKGWHLDELSDRFADRLVEIQSGRTADPDYEPNSNSHRSLMPFNTFARRIAEAESNDLYMTANNSGYNQAALAELWEDFDPPTEYLTHDPKAGFLWMGGAGAQTPLHHDLTSNFMAQVVGRKRVILASPFQTPQLYNHLHCYSRADLERPDLERFPLLAQVQALQADIEPGDLLFIPVGWWHQVRSLDLSITISFTNFLWRNDYHQSYVSYGHLQR